MLSPSDVSIDPVDGDTVRFKSYSLTVTPLHTFIAGLILFTEWQEMEASEKLLIVNYILLTVLTTCLEKNCKCRGNY